MRRAVDSRRPAAPRRARLRRRSTRRKRSTAGTIICRRAASSSSGRSRSSASSVPVIDRSKRCRAKSSTRDEVVARRARVRCRLVGVEVVDGRQDQIDGARVAAVDGRLRDPGGDRHAGQRQLLEAVADEDLAGRGEDRAVDLGVERAAGRTRRRRSRRRPLDRRYSISATVSFETAVSKPRGDVR